MEQRLISALSFHRFLNEEKLMGSKCKKCGTLFLPPRPICIKCFSREVEWVELKGKGKLLTFTSINVGPTWMVEQGYDRTHPYCSGVVELEEGVKIEKCGEQKEINFPGVCRGHHHCLGFGSFDSYFRRPGVQNSFGVDGAHLGDRGSHSGE